MSDKIISDINGLEPGELVDLFELDLSTGVAPLVVKKVISGATKANPVVITTTTAHRFENGDTVSISDVVGMTELNGNSYTVAEKTSTTFELSNTNGTGYTTYISGGTVTKIIDLTFRWHSGKNENLQEIVWKGDKYSAFPIKAEGFEWSGKGAIPRPTLTVANITSLLSSILGEYSDLVGSKLTRKRTFAKYLDAYCYVGGYSSGGVCSGEAGGTPYSLSKSECENSTVNGGAGTWVSYDAASCAIAGGIWYSNEVADDTADFAEEIWYVDRKAVETRTHIQFELTSAHDVYGVKLPARSVIANLCPWKYKGVECTYDTSSLPGGSCSNSTYTTQEDCEANSATWTPRGYKMDNTETGILSEDVCAKNFKACELRFPEGYCSNSTYTNKSDCEDNNATWTESQEIPFGGFPGAGMSMG